MSVPRHPVALRLEQQVGDVTRLPAAIMGLPLINGILPVFIIMGVLTTTAGNPSIAGILQTGLLTFGEPMTVAVILIEMDGTRREQFTSIPLFGMLFAPVVIAEAAVAETIETFLNSGVFHHFAGLVILTMAAGAASSEVGEYLPSPNIIVGLDLVASFEPAGSGLAVTPDPMHLLSAGMTAGTGVGFVGAAVLLAPWPHGNVSIDLSRPRSSVALDMLALDAFGPMSTQAPVALSVLAVTALLVSDPGSDGADLDKLVNDASTIEPAAPNASTNGAVADGGDDADPADYDVLADDASEADDDSELGYGYPGEEKSRVPWL